MRDKQKEQGLTFIIVGTLLLFYMLGILTRGIVVIIAAVYMIVKGFMMTGYHIKIMKMLGLQTKQPME